MVDYSFDRVDPIGSFDRGEQLGSRLGAQARNASAYRANGMQGVEDAAGRTGDLETANYAQGMRQRTRQFQDETTQRAYQRMEQIAPWARNTIKAASTLAASDPARARTFLTQNQQRFLDFGFTPEQIQQGIDGLTNADPAIRQQTAQSLDQAFSQHQDPNWSIHGNNVIGVKPDDGSVVVGGQLPPGSGGHYATEEELAQGGFAANTVVFYDANNVPHVIQQPHYETSRGQQYSTLPPGFNLDDGQN